MASNNYYDILNIAPDAAPEVIRAAYRALSRKYHPDLNPSTDAHRNMSRINEAYAVLSDATKRQQYDSYLHRKNVSATRSTTQLTAHATVRSNVHASAATKAPAQVVLAKTRRQAWLTRHFFAIASFVLLLSLSALLWQITRLPAGSVTPEQTAPSQAAYATGYPIILQAGDNIITVNNTTQETLFVQLYQLSNSFKALRSFNLPPGSTWVLDKIGDGEFSLHYQALNSGTWHISPRIQLKNTEYTKRYQNIIITI